MSPAELSEAAAVLAHGILKMQYPDGLPGASPEDADGLFRKFVLEEMPESGGGKLTPEGVVDLFERFYEVEG